MDEDAKNRFKWKFYRLTVELNIIVLLLALCILVFFIIHSPYALPVITGMLAVALFLSWDFIKKYKRTKAWLDENAEQEKKRKEEHKS
jgi:cytochrome b subunit of formate dehydrogenase